MKDSVRINIGTYSKDIAFELRKKIKERAKQREQKVKTIFRGRGNNRKELGRNFDLDMPLENATSVSVYVDVEFEREKEVIAFETRGILKERLVLKMVKDESFIYNAILFGYKGLESLSDEELLKIVCRYI